MGNNFFIFFTVIFLFSGLLYAQESSPESQPGYYLDKSAGEPVFKQRLVWDKDEYALYYEAAIQIFSGQYREYHVEITRNNFIEISLSPGRYRYSITPFDLLERRCDPSEWEEFTVTAAFQPEIFKIVPTSFYMDQDKNRELIIAGNNIFNDSIIYLRNEENELIPIDKDVTGNSNVILTFDDDTLIPGTYEVYIINPGGLDTFLGGFFIGYNKRLESFLKFGFNPVIPISGGLYDIFGSYLYYPCVTFRFESLSSARAAFKTGLEFALSLYYLYNDFSIKPLDSKSKDGTFTDTKVALYDFSLNISFQGRYNHLKNAVTFSFGFGFTNSKSAGNDYVYDDGYSYNDYGSYTNDYNGINLHANLSLSALFLLYDNFYIEPGVELTYYLINTFTLIKPKISLVLKI